MAKSGAFQSLGFAFESTFGTGVAATTFLPYTSAKIDETVNRVLDNTRRANLSKDFQAYITTKETDIDVELPAYPDTLGYLLKSILSTYSKTGTGTVTHTFKLLNGNSPSLTFTQFSGLATRQIPGSIMEELTLKLSAEEMVTVSAKFKGKSTAVVADVSPSYTTTKPFMGFQSVLKFDNVTSTQFVGAEISIKRETKLIYGTSGAGEATAYSTGAMEVTGKLSFMADDEAQANMYRNGSQPAVNLTLTNTDGSVLTIDFGKVDISKASIDNSDTIMVDLEFRGLYNATNGGPVAITLQNSVTTY
jgi:hypothetical protein